MTTTSLNILLILSFLVLVPLFFQTAQDDIKCLQGLKNKLSDPQLKLQTWNFANSSVKGFPCTFEGVSCWDINDNRLISLQLTQRELGGEIPDSLQYCRSLQSLDFSQNSLSGSIPSKMCDWLPYLVTLDLSANKLSGPVPPALANCTYLLSLNLRDNHLSGQIPYELSSLNRLKNLSISNNKLYGQIPPFFSEFNSDDFVGNPGLCGPPLSSKPNCVDIQTKNLMIVIAASLLCACFTVLFGFAFWHKCFKPRRTFQR